MRTDRKIEIVLYPDSYAYNCNDVILKAQSLFSEWAYILHNEDKTDDGEPKKAHIHFIGRNQSNMTPSGICYHLGIGENSLVNIKSWKGAVRYLIHADYPDKAQYSLDAVSSNFNLTPYFELKEDDACQARKIYDYIFNYSPTLQECIDYCISNNLWSAFRRGFSVWCKFINYNTVKERQLYESGRYSQN